MLVAKADAYGLGAVAIAHHALRCGVSAIGVGTSFEALELLRGGVRAPILVLGTVVEEELLACLRNAVHIGLHSADRRASLQELARSLGLIAHVHLNVDTGMGRLGVPPERALELLDEVHASSHLRLAGVMSHVSSPDGGLDPATALQKARFDRFLEAARRRPCPTGWVHFANSAALFTGVEGDYDTVRTGIAAYGALPSHLPGARELLPVLSLRSQVVFLKDIPAGTPVGYGSHWRAPRPTRIATLSIGYDDGVPWRLGDQGEVLLRGRRAPLVGRVSMDYTTVDVGDIDGVQVGDAATLIGADGEQRISIEEVAERAGTIPYEVMCSVGKRVGRVYVGGEDLPRAPARRPPADPVQGPEPAERPENATAARTEPRPRARP